MSDINSRSKKAAIGSHQALKAARVLLECCAQSIWKGFSDDQRTTAANGD
jgi:hypothetical protein